MVATAAGLDTDTGTGKIQVQAPGRRAFTAYLENAGTIENAQLIGAHRPARTTMLYDRTGDEITIESLINSPIGSYIHQLRSVAELAGGRIAGSRVTLQP